VKDERTPYFRVPPWATNPFPSPPQIGPDAAEGPREIVLHDRYVVTSAYKHANKGGIYVATDRTTDEQVVVKEGRPNVALEENDRDARGRILYEAEMLRRLAHTGRVPRIIDEFEEDGHAFLVIEKIEGRSLMAAVGGSLLTMGGRPLRTDEAESLRARLQAELVETVEQAHGAGVLLVDLTPNNLMVTDADELRLIDLELAQDMTGGAPDQPCTVGTRGFMAPEHRRGEGLSFAADHFAVGAILAYVADGTFPYFPVGPWLGAAGTADERTLLSTHIARVEEGGALDAEQAALIRDHLGFQDGVRAACRGQAFATLAPVVVPAGEPRRWAEVDIAGLIEEACRYLVDDLRMRPNGWVVTPAPTTEVFDPLSLQYGAAGVGALLCEALDHLRDPELRTQVGEGVRRIAELAVQELARNEAGAAREPDRPKGLYFGGAGVGWFLEDAAARLGEPAWTGLGRTLICTDPADIVSSDVTHGLSGLALAQLHLFRCTGDEQFLDRAVRSAREVLARSRLRPAGDRAWFGSDRGVDGEEDRDGDEKTAAYLGYAHGVAGTAHMLLCVGSVAGQDDLLAAAREGFDLVCDHAERSDDGVVGWPQHIGGRRWLPHWCNGAAGIGMALCRAAIAFDSDRYRELARDSALAVWSARSLLAPSQCHGLDGGIELLLDVERLLGIGLPRELADLTEDLWRFSTWHGDRRVFVDQSRHAPSAGFASGMAGTLALLIRLHDEDVPRPFMCDWAVIGPDAAPGRSARPGGADIGDARTVVLNGVS
jgi:tRNA A-37 threonylcarbamoyl transferase component Bud32